MIRVVDTRKRLWGREVLKHEHPLWQHSPITDLRLLLFKRPNH